MDPMMIVLFAALLGCVLVAREMAKGLAAVSGLDNCQPVAGGAMALPLFMASTGSKAPGGSTATGPSGVNRNGDSSVAERSHRRRRRRPRSKGRVLRGIVDVSISIDDVRKVGLKPAVKKGLKRLLRRGFYLEPYGRGRYGKPSVYGGGIGTLAVYLYVKVTLRKDSVLERSPRGGDIYVSRCREISILQWPSLHQIKMNDALRGGIPLPPAEEVKVSDTEADATMRVVTSLAEAVKRGDYEAILSSYRQGELVTVYHCTSQALAYSKLYVGVGEAYGPGVYFGPKPYTAYGDKVVAVSVPAAYLRAAPDAEIATFDGDVLLKADGDGHFSGTVRVESADFVILLNLGIDNNYLDDVSEERLAEIALEVARLTGTRVYIKGDKALCLAAEQYGLGHTPYENVGFLFVGDVPVAALVAAWRSVAPNVKVPDITRASTLGDFRAANDYQVNDWVVDVETGELLGNRQARRCLLARRIGHPKPRERDRMRLQISYAGHWGSALREKLSCLPGQESEGGEK